MNFVQDDKKNKKEKEEKVPKQGNVSEKMRKRGKRNI